jgi:hypothetical protein
MSTMRPCERAHERASKDDERLTLARLDADDEADDNA